MRRFALQWDIHRRIESQGLHNHRVGVLVGVGVRVEVRVAVAVGLATVTSGVKVCSSCSGGMRKLQARINPSNARLKGMST